MRFGFLGLWLFLLVSLRLMWFTALYMVSGVSSVWLYLWVIACGLWVRWFTCFPVGFGLW